MSTYENPNAFPLQPVGPGGEPWSPEYGMSLRDYFAGQALPSYITALAHMDFHPSRNIQECVEEAYNFADAMLVERRKAPNKET